VERGKRRGTVRPRARPVKGEEEAQIPRGIESGVITGKKEVDLAAAKFDGS